MAAAGPSTRPLTSLRASAHLGQSWSLPRPSLAPTQKRASGCGSWWWRPGPDTRPSPLPAVLVPGRGLAAVLRTLPMFHDEEHARACGLPEDTLVLP